MTIDNRFDELLDDWARDRLAADERAEFDAIIAADGALRAEARDHRRIIAAIASEKPVKAPAGLVSAAMARARAEAASVPAAVVDVAPPSNIEEIRPAGSRMLWFAAAAALVAMAGGYVVLRPDSPSPSHGEMDVAMANVPVAEKMNERAAGESREAKKFLDGPAAPEPSDRDAELGTFARKAAFDASDDEQERLASAMDALGAKSGSSPAASIDSRERMDLAVASLPAAPAEASVSSPSFTGADAVASSEIAFHAVEEPTVSERRDSAAGAAVAQADSLLADGAREIRFIEEAAPAVQIAESIEEKKEDMQLAMVAPAPTPVAAREVERPGVERRAASVDPAPAALPNRAERTADPFRLRAVDVPAEAKADVRDITPRIEADAFGATASAFAASATAPEPRMSAIQAAPLDSSVVDFFERQTRRAGGNVVAFADPKVFAADFPNQQALDSFLRMLEVVPVEVDRSDVASSQPATITPATVRSLGAVSSKNSSAPRYSFNDGGRMFGIARDGKNSALPGSVAKDAMHQDAVSAGKKRESAKAKTTMLDLDQYIVETVRSGESGRMMLLVRRKDFPAETHRVPARVQ